MQPKSREGSSSPFDMQVCRLWTQKWRVFLLVSLKNQNWVPSFQQSWKWRGSPKRLSASMIVGGYPQRRATHPTHPTHPTTLAPRKPTGPSPAQPPRRRARPGRPMPLPPPDPNRSGGELDPDSGCVLGSLPLAGAQSRVLGMNSGDPLKGNHN